MEIIKTKIGRRSFLKTSGAIGGGLLVGFNWLLSCKDLMNKKPLDSIPKEWFKINGYIRIDQNGMVTILSPNPEIGQNVMTSMPMIVAEELDTRWENVIVKQGKLDGDSFKNPQFAGGSLSIKKGWDPLRIAGAAGRYMLIKAASKELDIPYENLITDKGIIFDKSKKIKIDYGKVASKAVQIKVPDDLKLKSPEKYTIIGTSQRNVRGPKIVKGESLFGIDFQAEKMLISMIEHPPAFGMRAESFNKDEIIDMPGVIDAFVIDTSTPNPSWAEVNAFKEIIAIVGNKTWDLMQAKKKLKVNWVKIDNLEDSEDHRSRLEKDLLYGTTTEKRLDGDPDIVFKNATKTLERTYSCPFIAHNTLEPMNFFANVQENSVELVGPIQTPKALESSISSLLNIPIENIEVKMTRIGGGFGRRLYVHFGLEAAMISKKMGAPVKLIYKREDDITQGIYRPAYRSVYKAAFNKKNELTAFSVKGVGLPSGPVFPNRFPAGSIDHFLAENKSSSTNISTGAWRAPKSNFTAGAEQSFVDEIAEICEKDPIDFRLKLLKKAIQNPSGKKFDYDPKRFIKVLELVREKSSWNSGNKHKGVASYFCHSTYVAEVIEMVMVQNQPKIKNVWCAVDCGIVINIDSAKNMIEGSIIDGIGHALYSELNFKDGRVINNNFDKYNLIRFNQAPSNIKVFFVENNLSPTGLGEPGLPPAIGALANSLYRITGKRFYNQPFFGKENLFNS